ncbi:zinc-dependent alcohol dehydrogenase family protein [Parasphingopyxis sp.]|uniref:zinc-dependent alcohol dehydrogenase family protein n=1 Tax=Parasphingopyxis sp. TaxID=1920299 RepID=UPI002629166C|nr:zinc-dependent alcohol dehydrogenase family protein [Parasphingopyxis sp.]
MAEMRAMQLDGPERPLRAVTRAVPVPRGSDLLVAIRACGVCRTDLHVADGDIDADLPIVPGHEIVGTVAALGPDAEGFAEGDRVGVPWLGRSCGECAYCREGRENLCDAPLFTGFSRDGGFATHAIADARFCLPIPEAFDDVHAAPLLCAGLIGYRSLRMAGEGPDIGLYGFGAAAHIVAQVAVWQGRNVYAFTRPGDAEAQAFAKSLGCVWAGSSEEVPPVSLDAAIIFAPVGALVPAGLKAVRKRGRVVCAGIHMSDIPAFPYADLWEERSILSVANLTRQDGIEFMEIAAKVPVRTHATALPLSEANAALERLRAGEVEGALVLCP